MRRRTLLTAVAFSLGLAGCRAPVAESPDDTMPPTPSSTRSPTRTGTVTDTPTESPTTAPTETATETDTPTATDTETPTETETETPTETAEPTPSEAERKAANRIETARAHIQTGLDEYTAQAGADATFLDVSASVAGFEYPAVTNPLDDARTKLDGAAKVAVNEETTATIADLRVVADFLEYAARTQSSLGKAYKAATTAKSWWYDEKYGFLSSQLNTMKTRRDEAEDLLGDLEDATDADAMAAFEPLDEATYDDKIDQFETEIDTFDGLPSLFEDAVEALERFGRGVEAWDAENWSTARGRFENAGASFEDLDAEFDEITRADSFVAHIEEMEGVAAALEEASALLVDGATAQEEEGDDDTREAKKAAADERLRENDIARTDIESVERLLEAT